MLNVINHAGLIAIFFLGFVGATEAAVFQDSLTYGTNATMIGIGKVEGFTPNAGVVLEAAAGLTQAKQGVSLFYLNGMDNTVTHLSGAASYHLTDQFTVGAGLSRESVLGLDHTAESDGQAVGIGTFDYSNSTYLAGIGYAFSDKVTLGASVYHYQKQIDTITGKGTALGLSGLFNLATTDVLVQVKHLGASAVVYSEGDSESLPIEYAVAARHRLSIMDTVPIEVLGQLKFSPDLPILKMGGIRLVPFKDTLAVSLGYQESRVLDAPVQSGLTMGLDLRLPGVTVSYAYQTTQYSPSDQAHHLSVFFEVPTR